MTRRMLAGAAVAAALVALVGTQVSAAVLLRFGPDIGGGIPGYARIEVVDGHLLAHHDDTWTAIAFYRDPAGVPADFDLLGILDPALDVMNPGAARLTVEGFEIWRNGPWAGDTSPIQTISFGLGAVPVWFVGWQELQAFVAAHGRLTIADLESLPSLVKGSAAFFRETLHPYQAALRTKTQIEARGTLSDGRAFFYQGEENDNEITHVIIRFN